MIRAPLLLLAVAALAPAVAPSAGAAVPWDRADAPGGVPFYYDALGPIRDVTAHWQHYQPANAFCVMPEAGGHTPGGVGPTVSGRDPACRHSGYRRATKGLIAVRVRTPALCSGCRRLFIDFARIPKADAPPDYYPRGHVFFRLSSANSTYTVDPLDHSPNTKNFTNDKLLTPSGSGQEQVIGTGDRHQMFGYVTDTLGFVHTAIQGPYYVGPWYVNRQGRRIHGVYLDLDVADATENPGGVDFNDVSYAAGFNSGRSCRGDDDAFYGGCVDWWGYSTSTANPYAPLG